MASSCIPCAAEGVDETFEDPNDYYAHMETAHGYPAVPETNEDGPVATPKAKGKIPRTRRTAARTTPRKRKK
jgi:hypothetical protein